MVLLFGAWQQCPQLSNDSGDDKINEALAQVWHGFTLTACHPMLKSYCWAEITACNKLHEFWCVFADAALTYTSVCMCAFLAMCAADMQVVIDLKVMMLTCRFSLRWWIAKARPELLSLHTLLDRELQLPARQPNTAQDTFFYKT